MIKSMTKLLLTVSVVCSALFGMTMDCYARERLSKAKRIEVERIAQAVDKKLKERPLNKKENAQKQTAPKDTFLEKLQSDQSIDNPTKEEIWKAFMILAFVASNHDTIGREPRFEAGQGILDAIGMQPSQAIIEWAVNVKKGDPVIRKASNIINGHITIK